MQRHVDDRECREVCDLLELWVDGELNVADAARVQDHIKDCVECRSELQTAEQIASELRSLPAFDLPDRIVLAVRSRVEQSLWTRLGAIFKQSTVPRLPVLVAVAAVVVMAVVVTLWFSPSQPQISQKEVARATAETKLALAYVANATQRAERGVARKILEDGATGRTLRNFQHAIRAVGGAETPTGDAPTAPLRKTTIQGS